MHHSRLDAMFKLFRQTFAEEANQRFKLKGTPDEHTLLCLKMNPFLDMSSTGPFGKRTTQELMEGKYKTALRKRYRHLQLAAASSTPASSTPASSKPASKQASTAASTSAPGASQAEAGKRIKMSLLSTKLYLKAPTVAQDDDDEETTIDKEIAAFNATCTTANPAKYEHDEKIDLNAFWAEHRKALPIHYLVYLGDCASKRASSAAVETVYSGATKLSDEAQMLADDMLAAYVFCHYNWQYIFLRPSNAEIVKGYLELYGDEAPEEEEEETKEETEIEGEEDGAGEEEMEDHVPDWQD
jgi:hypothetical protein